MTKLCPLLVFLIYLQSILDNMSGSLYKFYTNGMIFFKLHLNVNPNWAICWTHLTLVPTLSRTFVGVWIAFSDSYSFLLLLIKMTVNWFLCILFLFLAILISKNARCSDCVSHFRRPEVVVFSYELHGGAEWNFSSLHRRPYHWPSVLHGSSRGHS